MNNQNSSMGMCFVYCIVGLILIVGLIGVPFAIFASKSILFVLMFFICIVAMTSSFAFIEDTELRKVAAGVSAFMLGITTSFAVASPRFVNNTDAGTAFSFFAFSFTYLLPCYYLGNHIKRSMFDREIEKKLDNARKIRDEISKLENENQSLNLKLLQHDTELKLIELLERCGGNTEEIIHSNILAETNIIKYTIMDNNKTIEYLNSKLNEY